MTDASDDQPERRGRGRPALHSEVHSRALLIEAALAEFGSTGYARASVEAVAKQAGMSTRTLYKFVANKAELYEQVVAHRIATNLARLTMPNLPGSDPIHTMRQLARTFSRLVLDPEVVRISRMIISEAPQFPHVAESYMAAVNRFGQAFDSHIKALCRAEEFQYVSTDRITCLRNMIQGAQRPLLFSTNDETSPEEADAWADLCMELFLAAAQCGMGVSSKSK